MTTVVQLVATVVILSTFHFIRRFRYVVCRVVDVGYLRRIPPNIYTTQCQILTIVEQQVKLLSGVRCLSALRWY
ncbi:hypothetical protein O9993_03210 [Vibrio lentus]|nr:hypothetical protein [Vibrio lentus]